MNQLHAFRLLLLFFCAALFGLPTGLAQDPFEDHPVRHIGPGTMSGRVTSLAVDPTDRDIIYAGTASGGLWRSPSSGATWEPLFDDQDILSIGSVAVAPSNPDVLWAGTGEGNPRNSHTSGRGIYRSIDGGSTWRMMGLEDTRTIHRIRIHPTDPKTVFVAAMGSAWGPNPERGVFRTRDGGETWDHVLSIDDTTGCAEMIMDPSNPDKLFAAMWSFHREPWFFTSGGEGSGLYVTHDGGDNWDRLGEDEGLPGGELGRMGLTMSPADPDIVYALIESKKTGLYKSTDGGGNWDLVSTKNIGNRPFYYAEIHADPQDPDRLFNLYSMVSESTDGGRTFEVILPYSGAHPDHHAWYQDPNDSDFILNGNDGGINISRDGGETWTFVHNLPVGQFYHINVDNDMPYNVYGGLQDNGSWKAPAYVWHGDGIRNEDWQEISFGDGFDVVPMPGDPDMAYSMSQGGNVYRLHIPTGAMAYIQPNHPDTVELRYNWNAAIAVDPHDPNGVYFGSQFVHYSADRGQSWTILSPDLTTNDPEKQKQAESGGLTIDATNAENHTTLLCITPHPDRPDEIWVSSDDGQLHRTVNGGETWESLAGRLKGLPAGSWIPQVRISPHNPDEVYVAANNYRRNDWTPYLFRTRDGGAKWERIVDGDDVLGHVQCVLQDPEVADLIWCGTEQGLWWSHDGGFAWQRWKEGVPAVPVRDMVLQEREADLVLGTFGRGVYIVDGLEVIRAWVAGGEDNDFGGAACTMFGPDVAVMAEWRRPAGERFPADAYWSGENRGRGARVRCHFNSDSLEALGKEESLLVHVLNAARDTVRTMDADPEGGMDMIRWDMRGTGSFWPSRRKRDEDARPGGGFPVDPGVYRLVVEVTVDDAARQWGQTDIEVMADPRRAPSTDIMAAQRAHMDRIYSVSGRADDVYEELKRMRRAEDAVSDRMAHAKRSMEKGDTTYQVVQELTDSLQGEWTELDERYFTPEDFNGYDAEVRISDRLWHAMSYADGGLAAPGSNADDALKALDRAVTDAEDHLGRIREVFAAWRAEVEAVDWPLFGEFED